MGWHFVTSDHFDHLHVMQITIASKTIVFERVEPQLRHLEPVGGESTLAHLSVHLHIFVHNLRKTITLTTFDHFWKIVSEKKKMQTSGYFEKNILKNVYRNF